MHRNLDRRVEAMVNINQPDHKRMLIRALDHYLSDTSPAWIMREDGGWHHAVLGPDREPLTDFHAQVTDWYRLRE